MNEKKIKVKYIGPPTYEFDVGQIVEAGFLKKDPKEYWYVIRSRDGEEYAFSRDLFVVLDGEKEHDMETSQADTIDEKRMIDSAKSYIETLFTGDYSGHDVEHTLRVYNNALLIAETEPESNRLIVSLAALLHDADDHKIFNTENNFNARTFLNEQNIAPELVEQICEVINGVSFSKNRGVSPETIEGKIVQDADRLDAMGALGIARTFAYGGAHGRSITDSLKHFDEKLLLLKDEMNTEKGKLLAQERHDFLVTYVKEFEREIGR